MLSQTTWAEKVCLFLGSFLALVQGATAPLVAMFTGNAVTVLQTSEAGALVMSNIRHLHSSSMFYSH